MLCSLGLFSPKQIQNGDFLGHLACYTPINTARLVHASGRSPSGLAGNLETLDGGDVDMNLGEISRSNFFLLHNFQHFGEI